jgi:hypothetical protein
MLQHLFDVSLSSTLKVLVNSLSLHSLVIVRGLQIHLHPEVIQVSELIDTPFIL